MVIKALLKLFGAGRSEEKAVEKAADSKKKSGSISGDRIASMKDLEGFVDYVVKSLVDYPEEVKIDCDASGECKVIKVTCRAGDRGKIIGKRGKTIMALRALVAGAAGRMQDKVTVEVLDDEDVKE